ncbi:MAG: AbrB/MazE/SpoVT family DNA-binding domain-containing protein [Bacillus sp. (in: Bacteria)]|nr:AbrB/MazE/SpoVT family DNA-binding domain-containing protein [Bacillus sp. (in: firmicutes)]
MSTKSYSKPVELYDAIDLEIECKVSKYFTVTIPKVIRERLNIIPGEQVNVGLSMDQQALLISKTGQETTTDNKMIVRDNNLISIPTELRRSLNLNKGDKFQVLTLKDRIAILRKEPENLVKRIN